MAGGDQEGRIRTMFAQLTSAMDFQAAALVARAERQRAIASNIANADTPGYQARDLNFKDAMAAATGAQNPARVARPASPMAGANAASATTYHSNPSHIPLQARSSEAGVYSSSDADLGYTNQSQPAMDNNSVDLDRERANFVDNAVRYEATLRFINGSSKTILSAIQGQ